MNINNLPFPQLFGPLDKDYCIYFYILSFIGLFSLIITIVSTLFIGWKYNKGAIFYSQSLAIALTYAILYFVNRIMFNICNKAL
jgi:hypothetical protein